MDKGELERVERLEWEATKAPWSAYYENVYVGDDKWLVEASESEDADFIAAARNAFPAMAAELKRLWAIEEAAIGLISDGGNQYINTLHKLLNDRKAGGK